MTKPVKALTQDQVRDLIESLKSVFNYADGQNSRIWFDIGTVIHSKVEKAGEK